MSSMLNNQDKTTYIEDAFHQQKQQKNYVSPYLTEKDRERGFFPSCRTDRFDWQRNNAMHEINGNRNFQSKEIEVSTEGKWNKLIMKTENEKVSRRSMTPQSNTHQVSQRVLNPNLLGTPKFEGIKVFQNLGNDNWQKRRQEGHERTIEMKHQRNLDKYIPNEQAIPNTDGREKRDFSRLGRNEFSNREQISQILIDQSQISYLDETQSRSLTPDRCLKTHLKSGLVPTEERNEIQRINRSKSTKFQGSQLKSLLVDNSSVITATTQEHSDLSQVEKISKKYINKTQKRKNAEENKAFWKEMKSDDVWKEEIKLRGENRYGQNCTKEYILAQNPMFKDDMSQAYTDLMSEKGIKANLRGAKQNQNRDNISGVSANKRDTYSKSPQPKKEITSTNNYLHKSPSTIISQDKHSSSKSPIRNNQLARSETQSNLSGKANGITFQKEGRSQYQLSKSPSCRVFTQQGRSKSPIQERDASSKSPSRYSTNNILKAVYQSYSSNNKTNQQQYLNRNNSKSPSQVGQRAPLSQISSHSNKYSQKSNSRSIAQQKDDQSSIRSVVQNLFQDKFNYQQQQQNKFKQDNDDNYSILSYSISQVGTKENLSPFKKNQNKSQIFDRKTAEGIYFGDSESTISHISNSKSKISSLTQNQRNHIDDKENIQYKQTVKKQRESSKSPLSNSSQISQILKQF